MILASTSAQPAATPRHVEITVEDDGSDCLDPTALRETITETLGVELVPGTQDGEVRVELVPVELGWRADLSVSVGEATYEEHRQLEFVDPSCAQIDATLSLLVALLLDQAWSEHHTLRPEPTPPAEPELHEPSPALDSTPPQPTSTPWSAFSGLSARAGVGDLAPIAGGVSLDLRILAPRVVSLGASAIVWPRAQTPAQGGGHGRFAAFDGAVSLCARALERPRLMLSPCAGARVGMIYAEGVGFSRDAKAIRARALADAALELRVRVAGPLWARFGLGAAVPVIRDRFIVPDGAQIHVLHRAWPVVPTASFTLELRSLLTKKMIERS